MSTLKNIHGVLIVDIVTHQIVINKVHTGVLLAQKGVLFAQKGVLLAQKGVLFAQKGVLLPHIL